MSQVTTDPIADMLTRIRNAIAVNKNEITLPHSNIKESVSRILKEADFISEVKVDGKEPQKELHLWLAEEGKSPKITEIERISKPGRRSYAKAKEIPVVKQGRGVVIVSTSKGMMSGENAKKNQIGGELICKVY